MTKDFIKNVILKKCSDYELVVLKGFSPVLAESLGLDFPLIDNYVIKDGEISLQDVNASRLMYSIIGMETEKKSLCTCESFISMCTQFRNLSIFGKKICVLENNMLELYPNPSNMVIPDFDSDDFQNTDEATPIFSTFYSFCEVENEIPYIQYIDNYSTMDKPVDVVKMIDPVDYTLDPTVDENCGINILAVREGALKYVLRSLYDDMALEVMEFSIEEEDAKNEQVKVLVQASKDFGCPILIHKVVRHLNVIPREELYQLLKRIWGYESFRMLKMYKDLSVNHEVIDISQGSIIETVVRQAEAAHLSTSDSVNHVLLTSPTGAGKSLLFQLSAIYLAEKYGLLTIVVSPLLSLMDDQVEGLNRYEGVATLNSNKTAADKETILNGVRNGVINILYLSPELLLSYSIKSFIGDRELGLMVIDEAHTVTTWGRDFRVDYWFLGDYLRVASKCLRKRFPVFALTATAVWDPSGKNDMVFDTIRSLNMDPCIKYIGVVRRDNISFEIAQSNISTKYEEERSNLTIKRMREALLQNRKAIFYFPFKRTIEQIVHSDEVADIREKLVRYHASLLPRVKIMNANTFRNGTTPIMCATKAFGMGIDVSDIQEVYHHAPTGCLSDYVQEIGRLARNPNIQGIAKIDFSPSDFRYIRKLHGLSAIKPYQLMQVLRKLMALYKMNGEKRNMLISSGDFSYIFPMAKNQNEVDQDLKSSLLLISNDLLNKLRFHAIIVRPKSMFSKCYIELPSNQADSFHREYRTFLKQLSEQVFIFDADKYWTEKYSTCSFANFKYNLAEGNIFPDYNIVLRNQVNLMLHKDVTKTREEINEFFYYAHKFLDEMARSHHRSAFSDMKKALPDHYSELQREQFVETFRMLYATDFGMLGEKKAYCNVFSFNDKDGDGNDSFQLIQNGYECERNLYISAYDTQVKDCEMVRYCDPKDSLVKLSEFMNSLGIADYRRLGGDQPRIFVRINNPYHLSGMLRMQNYENDILNGIYEKYKYSERVFTYFFTTKMTDQQRWDFIEAYFLGASEEQLLNFV